jgi:glyoxylase-like metal-dependent hydrolase (beta-lactamase superfamily II)
VPGLTWPTLVFEKEMTLFLGKLEVRIAHLGSGHTKGDTVVWLPSQKVLFSGDLVEYDAACYCGDAQLEQWPATLEALRALNAEKLVPGRGPALLSPAEVNKGLDYTKDFVTTLLQAGRDAFKDKLDLKGAMALTRKSMDPKFGNVFIYEHCLPFDVSRAYDEASGISHPRIWTAQRDKEMWDALQN